MQNFMLFLKMPSKLQETHFKFKHTFKADVNAFNFQQFKQIIQLTMTILNFKFANYGIQFMQQILMETQLFWH